MINKQTHNKSICKSRAGQCNIIYAQAATGDNTNHDLQFLLLQY
ncbi:MAG TPA: hypothetical protein VIM07_15360 [Chitinophagaceae bacterium]